MIVNRLNYMHVNIISKLKNYDKMKEICLKSLAHGNTKVIIYLYEYYITIKDEKHASEIIDVGIKSNDIMSIYALYMHDYKNMDKLYDYFIINIEQLLLII